MKQTRCRNFLFAALLSIVLPGFAQAATAVVRDGSTLQLGNVTYRLDGIDVPSVDQLCIDEHADSWTCGIDARDQLAKLVSGKDVRCDDLGPDPALKKRRIGACKIEGETTGISHLMVRSGFALHVDGSATGRTEGIEIRARDDREGLWKGCFVSPRDFQAGKQDGALLGAACRTDREREIRNVLFPEHLAMPPGCSIKGKFAVRARVTGNLGIYHLQACRSYPGLGNPDRWFCSEDDAQAAGFRRAYNCRAATKSK
ncbi:MAG: thermonuclease family protein [Bradyrhizobium sp.]